MYDQVVDCLNKLVRLVLVRDQSEILAIQEAQKRVNGTITEIVGIDWL